MPFTSDGTGMCSGNIYGTYIHGFFDRGEIAETVVRSLARRKGIEYRGGEAVDHSEFREREFDRLAEILRSSLDMDHVYSILRDFSASEKLSE